MVADRLHVTLLEVTVFVSEIPQVVIDGAKAVAAELGSIGALQLRFDRLESFSNNSACVLGCTADCQAAVLRLRNRLLAGLKHRGIKPSSVSNPHMTAFYDPARKMASHRIEALTCSTQHLSLLLSHRGCTVHDLEAEWALA
jgi:2'-5' RNA ligase